MSINLYKDITNVIVTGKSGAGKQPRIDILKEEFDLEQLSTGDIFRKYLKIFNDFGYEKSLDELWDASKDSFLDDGEMWFRIC